MADQRRTKRAADERSGDAHRETPDDEYLAGEPEQIYELQREQQPPQDPDEFVTDAEMEVREADSSPQDEDDV